MATQDEPGWNLTVACWMLLSGYNRFLDGIWSFLSGLRSGISRVQLEPEALLDRTCRVQPEPLNPARQLFGLGFYSTARCRVEPDPSLLLTKF